MLGVSGATPEDNLPSLGGNSLQAVIVAAELETHFGLQIPAEVFEERHNIQELASWIEAQRCSPRTDPSADSLSTDIPRKRLDEEHQPLANDEAAR